MDPLWLLKGGPDAPGWEALEKDSRADEVNLLGFDRAGWALVFAVEPPTKYEGLVPTKPADGLYVTEQGQPLYVLGQKEIYGPEELIKSLGPEAQEQLEKIGDPVTVLQRLGKVY